MIKSAKRKVWVTYMYESEKERLKNKKSFDISDLRKILEILRSGEGCPWDREQTHESIVKGFIEETYEVVEAIEKRDSGLLCEELGDVLLQIVFHSRIEEEKGIFSFDDVITGVCSKMIVRHPHVFGDVRADTSSEVLDNWDKIKAETKRQSGLSEKLEAIAVTMPSLMRMQKIIHKSSKEKVEPEISLPDKNEDEAAAALYEAVKRCEALGVDAETALRHYCDAYIKDVKTAE